MKNTLYFLLFTAMATLISCSENEQPPEEEPSPVVGEWYVEDINIEGTITETKNSQSVNARISGSTGSNEEAKVIFNNNNTYSRVGSHSVMIHTHFLGNSSFELVTFPYMIIEGTYEIEGNKMIYVANPSNQMYDPWDPRDTFEGTILELTENKMVIVEEHKENYTLNGAEMERKYQMTQIFVK